MWKEQLEHVEGEGRPLAKCGSRTVEVLAIKRAAVELWSCGRVVCFGRCFKQTQLLYYHILLKTQGKHLGEEQRAKSDLEVKKPKVKQAVSPSPLRLLENSH